jgi:stalled ribosome alternative rescue factor ArfA
MCPIKLVGEIIKGKCINLKFSEISLRFNKIGAVENKGLFKLRMEENRKLKSITKDQIKTTSNWKIHRFKFLCTWIFNIR